MLHVRRSLLSGAKLLPPPLDGQASFTGAWSFSRRLRTPYTGTFTTESGQTVTALKEQTAVVASADFNSSGEPPNIGTGGIYSRRCGVFDGSNDNLQVTPGVSNFMSVTDGYMAVTAQINAVTLNDATIYNNHPIMDFAGQFGGIYVQAATPRSISAFNYDGSSDVATQAFVLGRPLLFEWWHTGGNLFGRLNMGVPVSAASGNTGSMVASFTLGAINAAGTQALSCKIFEVVCASVVPSLAQRNRLADNMMRWIGAR